MDRPTIIRTQKDAAHPYVMVTRRLTDDTTLSWEARGLMTYLLGKPDTWEVRVDHLLTQGPGGRDRLYRMLHELEAAGYLAKERQTDERGRFTGWAYVVYEAPYPVQPDTALPHTEKPYTEKPNTGFPNTENPDALVIRNQSNNQRSNNQRSERAPATMRASDGHLLVDRPITPAPKGAARPRPPHPADAGTDPPIPCPAPWPAPVLTELTAYAAQYPGVNVPVALSKFTRHRRGVVKPLAAWVDDAQTWLDNEALMFGKHGGGGSARASPSSPSGPARPAVVDEIARRRAAKAGVA